MSPAYRRVLLKLSGEALAGAGSDTVDPDTCTWIAEEIAGLHREGVQFGIVIGGGNILRGAALSAGGMDRTSADAAGMLATVINALLLRGFLERAGVRTTVMCANAIEKVAPGFTGESGRRCLDAGETLIIAGGTGNPFFTTDTAAALRCAELKADALLKATKVDGVYDSDPAKNPKAVRFERLSYRDALERNLRVMDSTAFSFCREQSIPIVVFRLQRGNIRRCIAGEAIGSTVTEGS
jgi:uridylate kinase